ncbi:hypothetical protein [Roseovarius sp. D22-M7]|uniref:hypothetical protein n=1 Tax=Roseovarius sp. D22-M7 TaxID=3127116 RepID=UPI00300FDB08
MPVDGRCRWCCKPMPAGASICTECDRHDSRLFEYGKVFLTLTSIVGVLFSAAVFVADPARRIFNAVFFNPVIAVETFRTERSTRVRNKAGRSIFLTRYEVAIDPPIIEGDDRIPERQIIRSFDLIEQEIPPARSVQMELLSLEARRTMRLDGSGTVTPVPTIGPEEFRYVHQYRDDPQGQSGRILFYSEDDPELISRVADNARRDALPRGDCTIFYTAEFSSEERQEKFDCRAVAGFIGEFDAAIKGYYQWKTLAAHSKPTP